MRSFKDYYPDVIVGDVTSGRASVFTVGWFEIHEAFANQLSTRIMNGGSDLGRFRQSTFRRHRMVYRWSNGILEPIEEGQGRPNLQWYQKCILHVLKK